MLNARSKAETPNPNNTNDTHGPKLVGMNVSAKAFTVGIQGGKGSFNEEAFQHFVNQLSGGVLYGLEYLYTSDQVMQAVVDGKVGRGQCASYNSVGGDVIETTAALSRYKVKIIETFDIHIAHALMIRPDQDPKAIDTIMCHPQVLAQCKSTLKRRYPNYAQTSGTGELIDNAKTAEALAHKILPDNIGIMGSKILADIYGLVVLEDNLQDATENFTRFIQVVKG
ncbi:MAG: prephenate dehydratase domain-containing protein [Cyanobacteria bacterium P01_H01_bin.74]